MNRILFLEGYGGISGDMTVGVLLDLGADPVLLRETLEKLPVDGYEIKIEEKVKKGFRGCDFEVLLQEEPPHHMHRHYCDIRKMLEESGIDPETKRLAQAVFEAAACGEASVHGIDRDEVAFHEVGAVDSIVDIVSAAFCVQNLGVDEVMVSELWDGCGMIPCQHGRIPVPAPATAEILKNSNLLVRLTNIQGEMITPTGAALAAALKTREKEEGPYKIEKIGIGFGKREFPHVNMLRAMILNEE